MSEELKPCPFCNGDKARVIHIRDGRKVACICGACGRPEFNGPLDQPDAETRAIRAWNTRAPDLTERDDKGKAFYRIEQGLSEAAMHSKGMRDERAAIVAWLRKQDGHGYDDMRADLIEAGEHHDRV